MTAIEMSSNKTPTIEMSEIPTATAAIEMTETPTIEMTETPTAAINVGVSVVKQLHREIQTLLGTPLDGIQVIPNESDIMSLDAKIDGPEHTPFHGGSFRLRLVFTEAYPKVPPKGHFITPIFHPNVSPKTGEICVNTLQKDWNASLGLSHLLLTIKCLLILPNPESALNEEAGRLLLLEEDPRAFERQAAMMTRVHAGAKRPSDQNCQSNEDIRAGSAMAAMRKKLKRI